MLSLTVTEFVLYALVIFFTALLVVAFLADHFKNRPEKERTRLIYRESLPLSTA